MIEIERLGFRIYSDLHTVLMPFYPAAALDRRVSVLRIASVLTLPSDKSSVPDKISL